MSAFEPTEETLLKVQLARPNRIDLSALEKDYYLTEIFRALANYTGLPKGVHLVFTGGTSLSKRGIISRFSEDADFVLVDEEDRLDTRGKRRAFRKGLIAELESHSEICRKVTAKSQDDGRQIIIKIEYPSRLSAAKPNSTLRDHIRLEMRYSTELPPADMVAVNSLVGEVVPFVESIEMLTLSPLIIAANKFVGLAWRVIKRERAGTQVNPEDRNLVRHVHDLAALLPTIEKFPNRFCGLVRQIIISDRPRYRDLEVDSDQLLARGANLITAEQPYRAEYERFVRNMSFAPLDEVLSYEQAISAYKRIVTLALIAEGDIAS